MGSINSAFAFLGYKIDKIAFETAPNLLALEFSNSVPFDQIDLEISIRKPILFEPQNVYVSGIDMRTTVFQSSSKKPEEELVKGLFGIAGSFRLENNSLPLDKVDLLVKVQFPSILLPYLRAAITSVFAHAGFGSILIPLVNIHQLAADSLSGIEIIKIKDKES